MPHHKSCVKRLRQADQQRIRNNSVRTALRKTMKDVQTTMDAGEAIDLNKTYSAIDKVWIKGIIHKKRAARIKSRLAKANAKLAAK